MSDTTAINATTLGCSMTCKNLEASIRFYRDAIGAGAPDVDAAAKRITAAGGTLIDEPADRPWGVRMFQFRDLDDFKLGVSTPLAG